MKLINQRFKVLKTITTDSFGEVYLTEDTEKKIICRLRLFSIEFSRNDLMDNYKEVFIKYSTIIHPNIYLNYKFDLLYDVDYQKQTKKQYFYTYEDEIGLEIDYITLNREDSIKVLVEICKALRFLHFRGIVYKYLTFENINIYRDSANELKVKIVDLASIDLAVEFGKLEKYNNQFISPEIIWNESYNIQADIYSLGVILYFLYHNVSYKDRLVEEHLRNSIDNQVDKLISQMIRISVNDELNSIDKFCIAIEPLLNIKLNFTDYKYYNKLQIKAPILNRFKENSMIANSVLTKFDRSSKNNAVIVVGDGGTGKTRILKEAETVLSWEGLNVLHINCKSGNQNKYHVFTNIVKGIISSGDVSKELIVKYSSELVKLVPELSENWGIAIEETYDEKIEKLRIINRLHNFLVDFTKINKLVVILDAVQFLEPDEMEILNYIISNEKENNYFFICSYGSDSIRSKELNLWENAKNVLVRNINNFNYDQATNFVKSILGVGYNPTALTAKIMRYAQGNLKLTYEIMENLYNDGVLYVNDNLEWIFEESQDYFEQKTFIKVRPELIDVIKNITSGGIEILELLSLFKEAAPYKSILNLIDIPTRQLVNSLEELVSNEILKMKFDDSGKTYDFNSKTLKRSINEEIDTERKEELHLEIANFFESRIKTDKLKNIELIIHHYSVGKYKEKSVKYCIELAVEMENNYMYMQAIELYNRAVGILQLQNKQLKVAQMYYEIGRIQYLIGENEIARNITYDSLNTSRKYNDEILSFKCIVLLANIYLMRQDFDRCDKFIAEIKSKIHLVNDNALICDINSIEVAYYLKKNEINKAKAIITSVLADIDEDNKYKAEFTNFEGRVELEEGNLSEAYKSFEKSIKIYKNIDDKNIIKSLYPENNIGVLYYLFLDESKKSREYFLNIVNKLELYNLKNASALFVRNVGETYLVEDRYTEALDYLNKSQEIVENTMDASTRVENCVLLCLAYLKMQNYMRAYFYLRKLEAEYVESNNTILDIDYYMVHIEFYIYVKDYVKAEVWCEKLKSSELKLQENNKFKLKVLKYEVEVYKNKYFENTSNIDLRFVEVISKTHSNLSEVKSIRLLILRLANTLMSTRQYEPVKFLYDLDESLLQILDTEQLVNKRKIIKAVLKDDKTTYYNSLLETRQTQFNEEDKWLVYKLLGDEYALMNNYHKAISCYYNAMNTLKDITEVLPIEMRECYIFSDEIKLDLKRSIYKIHCKLINTSANPLLSQSDYVSVDDYFNLEIFNFSSNDLIRKNVQKLYKEKYGMVINNINELIQNFGKSEINNIRLVLTYCTQLLMGNRGFIFILDDEKNIGEVVKLSESDDIPDIKRIINSYINIQDGILLNSIERNTNKNQFLDNENAMLCIPIIKTGQENYSKRKLDINDYNSEVIGYIYIDANESFNNFNKESFDECLSLINMLYFFIDNYNLKRISTIDRLTNVYLRSYFEDLFIRERQRAKNSKTDLSVVMLDIDKFKVINDTYGHRKGDEILTSMCEVIKNTIRETDLIGRYGGEEFILALPNTNKEGAYIICEKIRLAIMNTKFLKDGKIVTISLGISHYPEHGTTDEELIEKADQALYISKNSGRNKTSLWSPNYGEDNIRFDKLAGILDGNISSDTRNVQAIIDIIGTIKDSKDISLKIELILNTITDICEAEKISLIRFDDGNIESIHTKAAGSNFISDELIVDEELLRKYSKYESANYFINWNDISELDNDNIPNWKSLIVSPLISNDISKGLLVVSVPISIKEFDFNTTNFVNSVSGIIATIL